MNPRLTAMTLVGALVLTVAAAVQAQPRTDQEANTATIIDYGYLFRLDNPGPGWRLMDETEVRQIVPDAVAGAMHSETGVFMVVIPEMAPGVEVGPMAAFIIDSLLAENKITELNQPIQYQGQNAIRYVVSGSVDGVLFRFGNTVVNHREHLYQVLCIGLRDLTAPDGSTFQPLWNAFSFLEGGSVPGRSGSRLVPDTLGVGWRTLDGTFESAAYGLVVEPTLPGWRVSVGVELDGMNPDAEVGLFSESPEIYAVLIPERAVGVDRSTFAAELRRMFAYAMTEVPGHDPIAVSVGGQTVDLGLYQSYDIGQPIDFAHGVFFHGEHAVQVVVWWIGSLREQVLPQLRPALAQIRLLEEAERTTLAATLSRGADPQNTVSSDFAQRRGLYRDYTYDFTWQKPRGFWRIVTGQAARAVNPDARVYIEEPSQGLAGLIIAERATGFTAEDFHALVLSQLAPPGNPALSSLPTPRTIGATTALSTWLDLDVDGVALRYLITTATQGDRLLQLLVWGLPGNVRASEAPIWEAVDGLRLDGRDLQPHQALPGLFQDDRLGFQLRSPRPDWPIENITPPDLSALSTIVQTTPDDRHGLLVFAMCSVGEGQDHRWFQQVAEETVLARFRQDLGVVNGPPFDDTLAGLPARHTTGYLPGGAGRVDLYTLQRDQTFIAVLAFDQDGLGPPLSELLSGFALLE